MVLVVNLNTTIKPDEFEVQWNIFCCFFQECRNLMFECACFQVVGMGELHVILDDDVIGAARVQMTTDQGQMLCNHVICQGHTMQKSVSFC